jgi:PAS domain S-box-containing protein
MSTRPDTQQTEPLDTSQADAVLQSRLLEDSVDCIKVLDLEGRLLAMNTGGLKALEICDLAPLLGASWMDFWQGADRTAARAAVETARAGGRGRFVGFFPTTQTRRPAWWDVVVSPVLDARGRPEKLLAISRDVTEWKHSEELLRALIAGTAGVTGTAFFRSLVRHLAEGLHVRWVFVAECLPNLRARTLAFWRDHDFAPDIEYALPGTPCMEVARGRTCHVPDRLAEVFPEDKGMIELGTVSYLGVPLLKSDKRIIGHLVVFDDKPMPADPLALSVMETFAARAGVELERQQADEEVRRLSGESEALLKINRAIGHHLHRDELFGALAGCLRHVVPADRFGIELPMDGNRLQGHILTPSADRAEATQPTVLPAEGTVCHWVIQNREGFVASTREELRARFPVTFDVMRQERMDSLCALPLVTGERCRGALFFMASAPGAYGRLSRGWLEQLAGTVAVALDDCLAHEEVRRLRDRLAAENAYLQEEIRAEHDFTEIVGNSPALRDVLRQVEQVAGTDSTALITGETGTGKELIARAIHDRSPRQSRPLVKVNCGAISAGLVESELFGHVKGAFTGALTNRDGRFKVADGGTIFLDEVGELPLETQVKLLRVLQEQEFEPIGSSHSVKVNVRIIAATNRDLAAAVAAGKFRHDLYYRLNVFPIHVPPLRVRPDDVPLLVTFFLQKFAKRFGKPVKRVSEDTMARLAAYAWPGNIRELQNVIERAVVLSSGPELVLAADFAPPRPAARLATFPAPADAWVPLLPTPAPAPTPMPGPAVGSLEEMERRHIESVLGQTNWMIEGARGAARILNLHPSTLRSRMQKLGIKRPVRTVPQPR